MKKPTVEEYLKMSNDQLEDLAEHLTVEELKALAEEAIKFQGLSEMERLRQANPALGDAWDQIKVVRELTETPNPHDRRPAWEKAYFDILDGVETKNESLKDAWDQYYVLKNLIVGPNKKG